MRRKGVLVITFGGFMSQDMRPLPPSTPEKGPEMMIQWPIEVSVTPMNPRIMLGGGDLMV